ncbi:MAG: ABC transporter permease, partial [archaeon]|nr:ABC transporter permease [archaeon]
MVTMTKHVDEPEETVTEEPQVVQETAEEPVVEETVVNDEPEPEKDESVHDEPSEDTSETPVESEKERLKREKKERKEREKAEKEEAKEKEKAEKVARKEKSKKKGDDNSPILERRDTVIKRSDSVAHRNVRYKPRGRISQTFTATRVELKRLKKTISPWILVLWAVAILVSANVDVIAKGLDIYDARQGLDILRYMGKFLFLLPIIAVFYCAKASGTVPVLFRDKIAYLHFALPVSKGTFYMGKFFAYLLLTVAMLTVFYGCSFVSAQLYYPYEGFEKTILVSYGLACLASFALIAMIMCF